MSKSDWKAAVAPFEMPSRWRSFLQLGNTLIPYLLLMTAMYLAMGISYWISLLLAIPAAGFMVRTFIIFHDCGHNAFFRSKRANRVTEFFTGLLVFMPAQSWSRNHAKHHATSGDLDRRGTGDIWTLTVGEYKALSPWKRFVYRVYRNPLILLIPGPLYLFIVDGRYWKSSTDKRQRWAIMITNIAIAGLITLAALTIGIKTYLLLQLPVLMIAGAGGIWLFYVQHQFDGTYWERHENWDFLRQALTGASFYKLPRVLQWFSGNIGFHHVHHLSPRIPNYFLEKCHRSHEMFQNVKALTLRDSLRAGRLHLWDEEKRRLVGFNAVGLKVGKAEL
jgi:acyl-lipid omega-6 desaturase (Delta-12 desaturase)